MSPTFVMTSAWWLDATPQACWPLLSDAQGWSRWWRSLAETRAPAKPIQSQHAQGVWHALLGLPLRLRLHQRAVEPGQSIAWQVQGDLQGSLTWVLTPVLPHGCDVTCRWEAPTPRRGPAWLRTLAVLLMERNHFARMRQCARDMGAELGCKTARLREWSGRNHR
jgi:hypothetical protein